MMKQPFIKFGVTTLFSLLCSTFLHAQVVTDERMFSFEKPQIPGKLNSRKQTDRFAKQLFFLFGKNTGSTSFLYGMEQQSIAQIFLQIIGFIFRGNAHFGNRQSTFAEVSCHIKKSFILINRSPVDSNQCFYTRSTSK